MEDREFKHNDFECHIVERPDILYMKQVCGFIKDKITPTVLFASSISFSQVEEGFKKILDGTFTGQAETTGDYTYVVSL
jgi:hypothetical protein